MTLVITKRDRSGTTGIKTKAELLKTAPTMHRIFEAKDGIGGQGTTPRPQEAEPAKTYTLSFSDRPGAMDAFRLPSFEMGRRVWPRRYTS